MQLCTATSNISLKLAREQDTSLVFARSTNLSGWTQAASCASGFIQRNPLLGQRGRNVTMTRPAMNVYIGACSVREIPHCALSLAMCSMPLS